MFPRSPGGAYVYATGVLDNAVAVFERDAASGSLSLENMTEDKPTAVASATPHQATFTPLLVLRPFASTVAQPFTSFPVGTAKSA